MRSHSTFAALAAATLLSSGAVTTLSAQPACACSCASVPFADQVRGAQLVARVTVENVARPVAGPNGEDVPHAVRVRSIYRGSAPERIELLTASSEASCGLTGLERGQEFLLVATGNGVTWRTGLCSGTQPWRDALGAETEKLTGAPHAPAAEVGLPSEATRPSRSRLAVMILVPCVAMAAAAWWVRRRRQASGS